MGLCVGKYGSDRYFGHNLDLYLILAHWPIYVLVLGSCLHLNNSILIYHTMASTIVTSFEMIIFQ